MKIRGDMKNGASVIALVLVIVVTISVFTVIATFLNNSSNMLMDAENEFKSSLVAYSDELALYIEAEKKDDKKFKEEELNVYGEDLRTVIPYIVEEDMAKFGIKNGKIVYIGNDSYEIKWTEEVLENQKEK
ncbi:MAG: hypothetical protein Q4D02_02440 [Clostridia bacterium]|nr:hypothetical protein [Clostridia bacterium]